jgi:hypothetical protein
VVAKCKLIQFNSTLIMKGLIKINLMKKNLATLLFLTLGIVVNSELKSQPQVTVTVQESIGGCGLVTDCENNIICVDIVMAVDQNKTLDSYNIWVEYDGSVISREAFNVNNNTAVGDNSCVIANGVQDTDLEGPSFNPDHWRVAGVPGNGFPMTANVPVIVHTICFVIMNPTLLNGQSVCVGGNVSSLLTTVTFTDATSDTNVPETCMVLDGSFNSCSLLPIELLSFTAHRANNASVLEWITSAEVNNNYFEIQRSDRNKEFASIGKVEALGNSISPVTYRFLDKSPYPGINYYRLKQVDIDGQFTYSPIRSVNFNDQVEFSLYPNPVSDLLYVEITREVIEDLNARYDILDSEGRLIESGKVLTAVQGIDVSGYRSGAYILSITSDVVNAKEKFIIVGN